MSPPNATFYVPPPPPLPPSPTPAEEQSAQPVVSDSATLKTKSTSQQSLSALFDELRQAIIQREINKKTAEGEENLEEKEENLVVSQVEVNSPSHPKRKAAIPIKQEPLNTRDASTPSTFNVKDNAPPIAWWRQLLTRIFSAIRAFFSSKDSPQPNNHSKARDQNIVINIDKADSTSDLFVPSKILYKVALGKEGTIILIPQTPKNTLEIKPSKASIPIVQNNVLLSKEPSLAPINRPIANPSLRTTAQSLNQPTRPTVEQLSAAKKLLKPLKKLTEDENQEVTNKANNPVLEAMLDKINRVTTYSDSESSDSDNEFSDREEVNDSEWNYNPDINNTPARRI